MDRRPWRGAKRRRGQRTRLAYDGDDELLHFRRDADVLDVGTRVEQSLRLRDRRDVVDRRWLQAVAREAEQSDLLGLCRVSELRLEEEPVELGLGQRVRALVLDRILCGEHQER